MKAILSAVIALLVCTSASAQTNPLLGRWRIETAAVAPWVAPEKIHELVKEAKREDKRNITLEVAQMIGPEPKHGDVDEAVKAVADERGISKSKVWKAWGVYGDAAQEALKRERVWDRLNHNKILP